MTQPEQLVGDAPWVGRRIGRFLILDEIASGGMATVHLAHAADAPLGSGPPRFVAAKRMHAHYARDPDFVSMFTDEATLCTHIRHDNVVATIEVTQGAEELVLVLELVEGESLSKLVRTVAARKARIPQPIASAIVIDMLRGLHAAHEAKNAEGEPLMIVHRDVSPHNVLVGTDGVTRVLDFGVAKARGRVQQTQKGQLKGKLAYMSPEQARGRMVDRRSDVFSAGIVLWELLTGQRMLDGDNEAALLVALLSEKPALPSSKDPALARFDALVGKALEVEPNDRYLTALEMAIAVEGVIPSATRAEVATWLKGEAAAALVRREEMIARATTHLRELERGSPGAVPVAVESVVPASGTVEKDEPPGVVDLGWSIPPPPTASSSQAAGHAVGPLSAARPEATPAQPPPSPRPPPSAPPPSGELTGTGALTVPLGSRSPVAAARQAPVNAAARPKTDAPPRPGLAGGAPRPRLEPKKPLGAAAPRPLASGPRGTARGPTVQSGATPTGGSAPNPSLLDEPLWDSNTNTEDIVAGALSAADALGESKAAEAGTEPRGETPSDATALQPLPTQVLPAPLTVPMLGDLARPAPPNEATAPDEVHSLRDATLPLYQPPAAYLEQAGFLGPSSPQAPASQPVSSQPISSQPGAPGPGSSQPGYSPMRASFVSTAPQGARASLSHEISGSFAAPSLGVAPPSFGAPPHSVSARPEAEGISSQVTSVNLTTTDLPPPLPEAHVRKLQLVALASGSVATLVCISLLVILTHSSSPAQATSSAPSASLPPATQTVVMPASAPPVPSVVMPPTPVEPEPDAAGTTAPSAQPADSAQSSAALTVTTAAAPAPSAVPSNTGPRPRPSGFLKPQSSAKPATSAKPIGSTKPKPPKK
jgi:eukaryotic-like serine/threonine-protein kinase